MNWTKIEEKHPKALGRLHFHLNTDYWGYEVDNDRIKMFTSGSNGCKFLHFNTRDLYDFFDEQGLEIDITPYHHNHKLYYSHNFPTNEYYSECVGTVREYNSRLKTRKEAETQAFEKAFEILEDKLNKQS